MNGMDMTLLRRRLRNFGFKVTQFSYASIGKSVEENAEYLHEFVNELDDDQIHFVAHSLGGLVLRQLFFKYPQQKPGRVVTLGTPHKKSLVAERFNNNAIGRLLLGKSLHRGLLGDVPPWSSQHDIGVIAGDNSLGVGKFFANLPKPNDGTVAVMETPLEGMKDYKVMNVNHMGMVFSNAVVEEVAEFLLTGMFKR